MEVSGVWEAATVCLSTGEKIHHGDNPRHPAGIPSFRDAASMDRAMASSNFSKCANYPQEKHEETKHFHSQSIFIWIWHEIYMFEHPGEPFFQGIFGLNGSIPTPRHQLSTAEPPFTLEVPGFAHGAKGVDQNPRSQAFGRGRL